MEHLSKIIGYTAKDTHNSTLGILDDIYIDERTWSVRYFSVIGSTPFEPSEPDTVVHLIPPHHVLGADLQRKTFALKCSQKFLQTAPMLGVGESAESKNSQTASTRETVDRSTPLRCSISLKPRARLCNELGAGIRSVRELVDRAITLIDGRRGRIKDIVVSHLFQPWSASSFVVRTTSPQGDESKLNVPPDYVVI